MPATYPSMSNDEFADMTNRRAAPLTVSAGYTLAPLDVADVRRALQIARDEAEARFQRDGTLGFRRDRMERLFRIFDALTREDADVRVTLAQEGR